MKIKKEIRESIIAHAQKGMPIEMCGYLAGQDGVITKHYELTNIDNSPEHFSFDPKEQFVTIKDARTNGLKVYAVYHSHPETPARPSEEDIKLAYDPTISYVIVSLAADEPDVKSFKIKDSAVAPEEIEIVE
ncbi:Mov34/MPN/PAD-1 [hydrothermal vent metagenome]|uniref:Mov34/MPN/PAD-1 n=1 Tax=hydrothermal vent metagenome TaxID=652676 RepID=A0A3B1DBQ2_9ZZZZ